MDGKKVDYHAAKSTGSHLGYGVTLIDVFDFSQKRTTSFALLQWCGSFYRKSVLGLRKLYNPGLFKAGELIGNMEVWNKVKR
jgi:hypothetical protein